MSAWKEWYMTGSEESWEEYSRECREDEMCYYDECYEDNEHQSSYN